MKSKWVKGGMRFVTERHITTLRDWEGSSLHLTLYLSKSSNINSTLVNGTFSHSTIFYISI